MPPWRFEFIGARDVNKRILPVMKKGVGVVTSDVPRMERCVDMAFLSTSLDEMLWKYS
jgi:hypothetical protein